MGRLTMLRILRITNMRMMINLNTNHTSSTSTLHGATRRMPSFHQIINMWMGLAVENMSSSIINSTIHRRSNTISNNMQGMVRRGIEMTKCGDNGAELWIVFPLLYLEILHFLLAWLVWRVRFTLPFFLLAAAAFASDDGHELRAVMCLIESLHGMSTGD